LFEITDESVLWVQAQLSFRVAKRLRSDLVDAYLHSDWAYRKSLREGYLVQLMGDSAQRAEIAIGSVVAGMSGLIVVLVPIVLLAVAQPIMFAMSAVGLVLIASILRPVSSRHKRAAVENARTGIRINAVCPGSVDTPLLRTAMDAAPQLKKMILAGQPGGRLGEPEEIAEAVVWLCSDRSSFVSGASLAVDAAAVCR